MNRVKFTAEDYLTMQKAWESLSGSSSEFNLYFPKGQYLDEAEQEAYNNLTGRGSLDDAFSFLNDFKDL